MDILENKSTRVLVRPDHIVEVHIKASWDQPDTVETATASALLVKQGVGGQRRATLFFLPNIYMKKEIVDAYSSIDIQSVASAMLVQSFGAKLIGNMALKISRRKHPSKVFTDQAEAEKWLKQFLEP
jgi:hypothetical protein